uniref:T-complex protein 11 n=1 Tax=Kalanchoe fedtschenkoi TaxID=63787 RepID=A0A7N0RFR8_KALFE
MAAGVDSSEAERISGIALEFPVSDVAESASPSSPMPPRLRERLLEWKSPSSTAEDIDAKLREADLRRQKFYEMLVAKARTKPKSPVRSFTQEEELGARLRMKLQLAERKRLSKLEEAQLRLAKLDELRQAAKTGVEMRYEKERMELVSKVESRVQQAEENRMLILKAYKQRRATLKERASQQMMRRMAREMKYRERIRAAINQKRAAAEMKRLGLLEAEMKRARARVSQVRRVAMSVHHQREIERKTLENKLEDKLQRARRLRDEYLRLRGRVPYSALSTWNQTHGQADLLAKRLARCWRSYLEQNKTTLTLSKAFNALQISECSVKSMPFEQLALLIESVETLQTVKSLLERFESRLRIYQDSATGSSTARHENIDHLLKRVASPKKKPTPRSSRRSSPSKKIVTAKQTSQSTDKLARYPVRIVLCAYMIVGHPEAVFSGRGEREVALAESAETFVREFESLLKVVLDGAVGAVEGDPSQSGLPQRRTFRSQLSVFDKSWCNFLNSFVVWKVKDAESLEEDLVRAACQLELSMIQTCKMTSEGDSVSLTHDMKAVQKQVNEDQQLLREKVQHLSGEAGIQRMDYALADTRAKYFQMKENGSPSITSTPKSSDNEEGDMKSKHVARALFKEEAASSDFAPSKTDLERKFSSMLDQPVSENELLVNEILHGRRSSEASGSNMIEEDSNQVKAKVREVMETAFWDGIVESLRENESGYGRIVDLLREVRDEFCKLAPDSWKEEINDAINLNIFAQILKSKNLDMDYLGKILGFSIVMLQKLSSPASDEERKVKYQKLMAELSTMCKSNDQSNSLLLTALIKGLRFVLEQIRELKQEIVKARMKMMEPLLKGSAGMDYLRKAFTNRYGSSINADSLPQTYQWFSSVWEVKDDEWDEHKSLISALGSSHETLSPTFIPPTTLRTGASLLVKSSGSPMNSNHAVSASQQPECDGESIDLTVRLGLLKLVCAVPGLILDTLPETMELNLLRLRSVQAQIQKIIVTATSLLIFRQILVSDRVMNPADLESLVLTCSSELLELLDHFEDAGIEDIVELTSKFLVGSEENTDKFQSRKMIMARMISKSLQAEDPVFKKVSRAIYLALRGMVLGGSGSTGKKLAEIALRQVGAVMLTQRLVETAETVVVVATVSVGVHGPWYIHMADSTQRL